jgi:hypothetical protein
MSRTSFITTLFIGVFLLLLGFFFSSSAQAATIERFCNSVVGDTCTFDLISGYTSNIMYDGVYPDRSVILQPDGCVSTCNSNSLSDPLIHSTNWMDFTGGSDTYFIQFPATNPSTTEFNEVLNYIPDTGFSTTTGTTTVGVLFSIPQPSFIEYLGYRIFDPSGDVVFNATSTVLVPGQYQISTDFNFEITGTYQGHAYFAQDLGGGDVWEIDNPFMQNILVDVTDWTISPDGQFSQNPATTSTTTLSNLNLDCGDGFAGSICNLVARVFIPSSTSIGLIQTSFNNVVTRAPFSFFTQAHTLLSSLRLQGTPAPASFSFIWQGDTFPVVSTTTAAAIGLTSSQLAFLKFIEGTALWILFAWFVYWRIASILGV